MPSGLVKDVQDYENVVSIDGSLVGELYSFGCSEFSDVSEMT